MPTLPATDARHRAALVRSARMGGSLARLVRAARKHVSDSLPATISVHDAHGVRVGVERTCAILAQMLGERFRALLLAAARREHYLTAVRLTRAVRTSTQTGEVREGVYDYARLILPAPVMSFLERVVGDVWRRVLGAVRPERAGNVVLQGVAAGKDRKQIAAELAAVFDGAESAARRVARTAGLQVATSTQLAVSEQIPDLVVGYELYTVLDDRVRPEHRAMHGAKFYRVPKRGQKGLSECPQPPVWGGKVEWNCRCFLIPILEIDGEEV